MSGIVQWLVANSHLSTANFTYVGASSLTTVTGNSALIVISHIAEGHGLFTINDNKGNPSPALISDVGYLVGGYTHNVAVWASNNFTGGSGHTWNIACNNTNDVLTAFMRPLHQFF